MSDFSKQIKRDALRRSGNLCEATGLLYKLDPDQRCNGSVGSRGTIFYVDDGFGQCIAICRSCFYARFRHPRYLERQAICAVEGCDHPARTKSGGMCETHYYREYRGSALGTGPIHPPCATCGAPISGNQSKFCSAKCGWTVRRLDWPGKLKNADFIHRARAKKHGVRWEVVDLMAIVERDGFNCQICGMPIDPEAPVRGKFSLSIDHIIPLAIGGSHTADNVRATHLVCNLGKAQTSDTPKAAKTKRQSDKHLGIRSAAKRPLPGTKASGIRKRMSGQVEEW